MRIINDAMQVPLPAGSPLGMYWRQVRDRRRHGDDGGPLVMEDGGMFTMGAAALGIGIGAAAHFC